MATKKSEIPSEVITEAPKCNPSIRTIADAQSENEENCEKEGEEDQRKQKQLEDTSNCHDPNDDESCGDCLKLCCCLVWNDCVDCCDKCDECDDCDGDGGCDGWNVYDGGHVYDGGDGCDGGGGCDCD